MIHTSTPIWPNRVTPHRTPTVAPSHTARTQTAARWRQTHTDPCRQTTGLPVQTRTVTSSHHRLPPNLSHKVLVANPTSRHGPRTNTAVLPTRTDLRPRTYYTDPPWIPATDPQRILPAPNTNPVSNQVSCQVSRRWGRHYGLGTSVRHKACPKVNRWILITVSD